MSKLDRMKKMSLDELRVRGAQAFSAFSERRGWSSIARLPTDQAFLKLFKPEFSARGFSSNEGLREFFRTRREPNFFAGFADPNATVTALRQGWPGAEKQIIEKAAPILAGKFDLLGLHDLNFGDPIDWSLEPLSGKRAPLDHWSRLNYLDAGLIGDKKIVWELNRHQYFAALGQAYWLTNDERYADCFVAHLTSWMDQNPPKLGINWASSLEVSFRSISWLWAFYFFKDSTALTPEVFWRTLKFLYLNARHLETYLSTYFSPNTHLTGEALGLFYLGTLLPEFREASRWRETGRKILLEQLARHVRPDGVYFEQSSYYHRYTTDFYTHFKILSQLNGEEHSVVDEKLELLLDHLMYITRPDGTTPFFGDDDGGKLLMLDQRQANDFRAALSNGAALFGRGDYKHVAREATTETLWLLGPEGLDEFDRLLATEPAQRSVAFAEGGYYVMRDGWTDRANYLLVDCGPHGTDNCGHAHADALSFDLASHGRTMLLDPGTYTYTASRELRDWFRGSLAHNTLTVDGESSSVSAGPFSWQSIARCETRSWISRGRFDYFEGTHGGYARLAQPVSHNRGVLFLKNDYWVLRDRVVSAGEHQYDLRFHFDSGTAPVIEATGESRAVVNAPGNAGGLTIAGFGGNGAWRWEEASVSHCYGEQTPAPAFVFSLRAAADDLTTFLLPSAGARSAPQVREIEAIGGHAFEVVSENARDIVMIGSGGRVETARLAGDFEWIWARFGPADDSIPEELVLIGGRVLELEGKEIMRAARRINYLVASRVGEHFRIETDDGVLELSLPIHDFEAVWRKEVISNQ
jgi:hypothetical protein